MGILEKTGKLKILIKLNNFNSLRLTLKGLKVSVSLIIAGGGDNRFSIF